MSNLRLCVVGDVKTPTRGTPGSAGLDFYVPNDLKPIDLLPGEDICIPSGIHVDVPKSYMLTAFNKSGVALTRGLTVGACVVDEDYQGEVHIHLFNVSNSIQKINPGDKIVQFILVPVIYPEVEVVRDVDLLFTEETERGSGGFGSTGS